MLERGWRGGCFSFSRPKVAAFTGAKDSSELAILTAPLKSPSFNLAATRAAKALKGSLARLKLASWVCVLMGLLSPFSSLIARRM